MNAYRVRVDVESAYLVTVYARDTESAREMAIEKARAAADIPGDDGLRPLVRGVSRCTVHDDVHEPEAPTSP